MKVVQFLDSDRDIDGEAASVATWSIRKNGSLPTDTQYILYTVNERHFNNPIVNAVFDVIEETVAGGDKVAIPGFGTFERKYKEARTVRNPQTGENMMSEAKNVPVFKFGKEFKEKVK